MTPTNIRPSAHSFTPSLLPRGPPHPLPIGTRTLNFLPFENHNELPSTSLCREFFRSPLLFVACCPNANSKAREKQRIQPFIDEFVDAVMRLAFIRTNSRRLVECFRVLVWVKFEDPFADICLVRSCTYRLQRTTIIAEFPSGLCRPVFLASKAPICLEFFGIVSIGPASFVGGQIQCPLLQNRDHVCCNRRQLISLSMRWLGNSIWCWRASTTPE